MTGGRQLDPGGYLMMLQGLEQMADLYKHAKKPTPWTRFRRLARQEGPACIVTLGKKVLLRCRDRLHSFRKHSGRSTVRPDSLHQPEPGLSYEDSRYFRDGRIAVYMAMFGSYDRVPEPLIQPDNIDYYILTDKPMPEGSRWKALDPARFLPEETGSDPVLRNRWCKLHPHRIFPGYDTSIYLDSNLLVVSDLTPFASFADQFPVAVFHHWQRTCVYQEIRACLDTGKDTREHLLAHEKRLRAQGVPENWGLLEAPVIARMHGDSRCIALMEAWWDNFLSGSRRDQISLIETLWQKQILPEQLGTLGPNVYCCNLIIKTDHRLQPRRRR